MNRFIFTLFLIATLHGKNSILTLNEPLGDIRTMKVNVEIAMCHILIKSGQNNMAVAGYLQFNKKISEGVFNYQKFGSKGILTVATEVDFDWSFWKSNDSKFLNECEVHLTPNIQAKINIDLGMGKGEFQMNNLQLSEFILNCGLGDANVDFGSQFNPIECKQLDIATGLGSIQINNLSNLNTDKMNFNCGLGSIEMDFSGSHLRDIDVQILVGLGSVDISIPRGRNVEFRYDDSFLSNVDLENFKHIDDGEYRSEEFIDNNPVIYFSASIGAGSITLNWIN